MLLSDGEALHLTVGTAIPYALQRGLLSVGEDLLFRTRVDELSRRNLSFRIVSGNHGILFKQVSDFSRDDLRRDLENEAKILVAFDALSGHNLPVPRFIDYWHQRHVLTTELLYPATTYTKVALNLGRPRLDLRHVESLANALASTHAASAELAATSVGVPWRKGAFPLGLGVLREDSMLSMGETGRLFLAQTSDWNMMRHAHELRKVWQGYDGLCHGDFRWDNLLVTPESEPLDKPLPIHIIDWELAAVGDPHWDLACGLVEFVRFWAMCASVTNPQTIEEYGDKAPIQLTEVRASAERFAAAYLTASAETAAEGVFHKVADYIGTLFYFFAWENCSNLGKNGAITTIPLQSLLFLDISRRFQQDAEAAYSDLFGSWPS